MSDATISDSTDNERPDEAPVPISDSTDNERPDEAPVPISDSTDNERPDEAFPREYVESLRGESRRYRERAQSAEQRAGDLAAALWRAQVAGLDRLADPDDLPLPEDTDPLDLDAVTAAIDALLEQKPHLAARRARGDVGQHERRDDDEHGVSLAALLRAGT